MPVEFPAEVAFTTLVLRNPNPEYIEIGDGVIVIKQNVLFSRYEDTEYWLAAGTYKVTKICSDECWRSLAGRGHVETVRISEELPTEPVTGMPNDKCLVKKD